MHSMPQSSNSDSDSSTPTLSVADRRDRRRRQKADSARRCRQRRFEEHARLQHDLDIQKARVRELEAIITSLTAAMPHRNPTMSSYISKKSRHAPQSRVHFPTAALDVGSDEPAQLQNKTEHSENLLDMLEQIVVDGCSSDSLSMRMTESFWRCPPGWFLVRFFVNLEGMFLMSDCLLNKYEYYFDLFIQTTQGSLHRHR